MCDDEYEGWTNRETWAIQLHLSNNEGDYTAMRERAEGIVAADVIDDDGVTVLAENGRTAVGLMADFVKAWTEEVFDMVLNPEGLTGYEINKEARMFVSDVGSWWRADFYEIATHWIDEAREEIKVADA